MTTAPIDRNAEDARVVRPKPWWRKPSSFGYAAGIVGVILLAGFIGVNLRSSPPVSIAGGETVTLTEVREVVKEEVAAAVKPISDSLAATDASVAKLAREMKSLTASTTELAGVVGTLSRTLDNTNARLTQVEIMLPRLRPDRPAEPVTPVSTVSIDDITLSCDGTWLEQFYVGKFDSVEEWLAGASVEYRQDVLNNCPPLIAVSPKDPPSVPVADSLDDKVDDWMAKLEAACPDHNFDPRIVAGILRSNNGTMILGRDMQDCNSFYTGVTEGRVVVQVANKPKPAPVATSDTSCSISVVVLGGRTVPVYILANGRKVSGEYAVGSRGKNIPVPCSVVRSGGLEVCFRGTGESELVNGNELRRMRQQYERAVDRGLSSVVLNDWGPIGWKPG